MVGVVVLAGCAGNPAGVQAASPFLALGDSLTADAFATADGWVQAWGAGAPAFLDEGARGQTSDYALPRLREVLPAHPEVKAVGLAFGTNDILKGNDPASFETMLGAAVAYARAQGREPRLATIPYSTLPALADVPKFNAAVAAINQREGLAPGPDLYAYFQAHPELHGPDGIHMTAEGSRAIQRLWVEALRR
jgi:lysophospholipase L1-like esterase